MPAARKPNPHQNQGFGRMAREAGQFGINAGRGAVGIGKGAYNTFKTGRHGFNLARRGMTSIHEEKSHMTTTEHETQPLTEQETMERIREANLEEAIRKAKLHPVVEQKLNELIEDAMQKDISGREMHKLLGDFFSENWPHGDKDKMALLIRRLLFVTHPEYAKTLKPLVV